MKNILALIVLAAFVGSAQAASLNWAAVNVYQPETTTLASNYSIYLFITEQGGNYGSAVTTTSAVSDLLKSGVELYTDSESGKKYLKNGNDKVEIAATGQITNGRIPVAATGYNGNNFASGDSLKGFAVIFDAANIADASNYIMTTEKSAAWTSGTGAKSLNFGSMANSTWTPVPEPSTAVLALAGLALLLKRRRA